jgi:membrane protein DedA with SNARE-associated domain
VFGLDADSVLAMSGWALYATLFFLPFLQEDAAVIAASTASISGLGPVPYLFATILLGLTASDVWKYWLGAAARRHQWAHKFAEKPGVSVAGDMIRGELAKTLYMARFVPGTRIPTYVACGFFKTPYLRFVAIVVLTAFTYVAISFALFHTIGAVAGEQAKYWMPFIAVALIGGYIVFRYVQHRRNKRLGPLEPITNEPDHAMPDMPGFEGNPLEEEEEQ